ncbi:response regulator transcription factor [Kibdelosporangium lantanae]|uniref:Response regulator transcription factor n=1 Tax=Kibdelosporangium lantanae TaxID=1497396 RepID=A0ABW3M985_9PSEU
MLLLLVCVTFITIMGGSLNKTWSLFEHLITPMLVLVDFLAVGRNQVAVKWWHPITWTAFPLAYLIYYVSAGLHMYGSFLNPKKSSFAGTVAGFVVGVLFVGFLLFLFGMMKASATGQRPPRRQQQPGGTCLAAELFIGETTVKTHINNCFAKIGARNRAEAVRYAFREGLTRDR